jgi:hypothetical protein
MRKASSSIRRGTCASRSARHTPERSGCGGQTAVGTEWFGPAGIGNLLLQVTGGPSRSGEAPGGVRVLATPAAESYLGQTVADSNTPRLPATSARNETADSRRATTRLPQLGIDNQHWDAPPKPRVIDTIVIPEGAGLCQGEFALVFSSFSASVRAAPGEGRRSRRSARSVARTTGLDRGPARRRLSAAGERCVNSVVVRGLQCDVYGLGPGQVSRLPVIPSPE